MLNWLSNLFKKKPKPIKTQSELSQHLDKVLNYQAGKEEENLSQAEKMLIALEKELKEIILKKREIEENYQNNLAQLKQNKAEATKLENKIILLYDYWKREVEILKLQEQLKNKSFSMEREKISAKLDHLIIINAGLEKGTRMRKIDPRIILELRNKLGIYHE